MPFVQRMIGPHSGGDSALHRLLTSALVLPSLGPVGGWEPSLRPLLASMADMPYPMALVWSAERRLLYNAHCGELLGDRHPAAFGDRIERAWPDAAAAVDPLVPDAQAGDARAGPAIAAVAWRGSGHRRLFHSVPVRDRQGLLQGVMLTIAEDAAQGEAALSERRCAAAIDHRGAEHELQQLNRALEERVKARTAELEEARRQAIAVAQRLQFTLDAAEIGDWDLDLVTDAAHRSLRHDQCFGYSEPIPEWGFETFITHVHPDDREPVQRHFEDALKGLGDWHFECRVIWPDGSVHWIAAHGTVYLRDKQPQRMSGIVFDITERKQAEGELLDASERKDEFLAMLAHELRNPLAPIGTAAQLLHRACADPQVVERAAAVITRQVAHMTTLVDDLLDVSRVTRGQVTLAMTPIELRSIVSAAIEQARPLMKSRQHVLTTRTGPDAMNVIGDRTRLIQVVTNLLNNAAKYTPEGGVIDLAASIDGDVATVSVKDTGQGMDSRLLPSIFELFTQGERAADQGGLGIGLALVRSIVQLHGGTVSAHSEGIGRGSCFCVRLPLSRLEPPVMQSEADRQPGPTGPAIRVLVVDDNRDAAESIGELLRFEGHHVSIEHDARSALQTADSGPPFEAYILDIGLPDMTGHALAAQLREKRGADALFIALTGYGQARDVSLSHDAGFDHHLVKPVNVEQLFGILREWGKAWPGQELGRGRERIHE
jgi:PAS domain S-box-containing protein